MAYVIRKCAELFIYFNDEVSDPRVVDWPLMKNPLKVICLLALYLYFVLSWGPRFMKNRKPYKLENLMIVFNLGQILCCGHLVYIGFMDCFFQGYNFLCEPVDFSSTPYALRVAGGTYSYFLLKVFDLLDTVFFVLRKKQNQVTFLHVYHHAGMVLLSWHCVKYLPGGHGIFMGVLNSFVHVVMYSYYLLTAFSPKYKNNIWWKKYITQLQILQFFLIFIHWLALLTQDCGYPKFVVIVLVPQNLFMFILFGDFYYKAYIKKKPSSAPVAPPSTPTEATTAGPDKVSPAAAPQTVPKVTSLDGLSISERVKFF